MLVRPWALTRIQGKLLKERRNSCFDLSSFPQGQTLWIFQPQGALVDRPDFSRKTLDNIKAPAGCTVRVFKKIEAIVVVRMTVKDGHGEQEVMVPFTEQFFTLFNIHSVPIAVHHGAEGCAGRAGQQHLRLMCAVGIQEFVP